MDIGIIDNHVYGYSFGQNPARVNRIVGVVQTVDEMKKHIEEEKQKHGCNPECDLLLYIGPNIHEDVPQELRDKYPNRLIKQVQFERVVSMRYDLLWNNEEYYFYAIGSSLLPETYDSGKDFYYGCSISFDTSFSFEEHKKWYIEEKCREYDIEEAQEA